MNLQRLRQSPAIRNFLAETHLHKYQLIMPIFVHEGLQDPVEITSMPGIFQLPVHQAVDEARAIQDLGINAIILFGIPKTKDPYGCRAKSPSGGVQTAIRAIKEAYPSLVVIADCCLCEYTDHGHCSVFDHTGQLDIQATWAALGEIAISYAAAGADIIAPSCMMGGMVTAIRNSLDSSGYSNTLIMSYAVKYASALYGPFREAGGTSLGQKTTMYPDRRHHQMNPTQAIEAYREASKDTSEGADILMVKPAGFYLDIISKLKATTNLPLAAYQVSGEYAMIKAAAQNGWLNEADTIHESLMAIKRAGADLIITYFAKQIAPHV